MWEGWRDMAHMRQEARVDVYLGKSVREAVFDRSTRLGISMTAYIKGCILHFVRQHPADADPRR
jgi:hypothetical protein